MLCKWQPDTDYELTEARDNVEQYGVMYRPSDNAFAIVRHPILGPAGEYAIDRVALRARAYIEFRAFGKEQTDRADVPPRLEALLQAIQAADRLYTK